MTTHHRRCRFVSKKKINLTYFKKKNQSPTPRPTPCHYGPAQPSPAHQGGPTSTLAYPISILIETKKAFQIERVGSSWSPGRRLSNQPTNPTQPQPAVHHYCLPRRLVFLPSHDSSLLGQKLRRPGSQVNQTVGNR